MDIRITPMILFGEINAISSKSNIHRLALASALASGETKISFTTLSDDIKATFDVLSTLGAKIKIHGDDKNYTASVFGIKEVKSGATLDANECGTTARLILPIAAALTDSFTLTGRNGLLNRPFADLCNCMAENGTTCLSTLLPISVKGRLKNGIFSIRGNISSQYISGLLFALPLLDGDSEIRLTTPLVSSGYIDMTLDTLRRFNINIEKTEYGFFIKGNQKYISSASYTAEGDWSNAAFWLSAGTIGGDITVKGLNTDSWQKDKNILKIFTRAFSNFTVYKDRPDIRTYKSDELCGLNFNGEDFPDLLPVLATVLSLAKGKSVITGASRLKIKESDRIKATVSMLKNLGANIEGTDDGFIINGVESFTGGTVDAANDHRIAMCAAIASQRASGDVIIKGAECVNKSYPTFFKDFEKLGGKYSVIDG